VSEERRGVTKARVLPTRIPPHVRPRLTRLARRGHEVCRKHGAKLLAEISMALEVALVDLAGNEARASDAERRARRAELELGHAKHRILELEKALKTSAPAPDIVRKLRNSEARIKELELYIHEITTPAGDPDDFQGSPTAVNNNSDLVARCKESR